MRISMDQSDIEQFMHHLCDQSANEIMPRFRSLSGVDNKLDTGFDPVTEADREAELVIRNTISEKYPEHGILGEEFGAVHAEAEYCWIIDPIDGTRSFVCGLPTWGTLIGLYHNGIPLAGVMDQPFTGERYLSNGTESYLTKNGKKKQLKTTSTDRLSMATMLTTDPRIFSSELKDRFLAVENACQLTRYGTDCYGYALVASGQVDLVVESGLNNFDIAALIPIVETAGGIVTNWDGDSAASGGNIVAAANKAIHDQALELLVPMAT